MEIKRFISDFMAARLIAGFDCEGCAFISKALGNRK